MIILVNKFNRHLYIKELASMHNLRKRIFKDRCGWDLNIINEMEFDQFDTDNASYILIVSEGDVVGSSRLIPTLEPYLLNEVFSHIVNKITLPHSRDVWEITRFCADPQKAPKNIMGLLLTAIMEFGLNNQLANFVSIADIRTEPLIKRAGWYAERIGETINTGTEVAVGQRLIVDAMTYRRMKTKLLIQENTPVISNYEEVSIQRPSVAA